MAIVELLQKTFGTATIASAKTVTVLGPAVLHVTGATRRYYAVDFSGVAAAPITYYIMISVRQALKRNKHT